MDRQFWISGVLVSVLAFAFGFVVHGMLLAGDYAPLAGSLYRTTEEAQGYLPYLIVAHLSSASPSPGSTGKEKPRASHGSARAHASASRSSR